MARQTKKKSLPLPASGSEIESRLIASVSTRLEEGSSDVPRVTYFRLSQRKENALAKKWDGFSPAPMANWQSHRHLTQVEVNPFCEESVEEHIAEFSTEREATEARQSFQRANESVGLHTQVVVVGFSAGGKIMSVDGELIKLKSKEDESDMPF